MGPQARREYMMQMRRRYLQAARRSDKARLLSEVVANTGYHRFPTSFGNIFM
jgi:hypothetical protein